MRVTVTPGALPQWPFAVKSTAASVGRAEWQATLPTFDHATAVESSTVPSMTNENDVVKTVYVTVTASSVSTSNASSTSTSVVQYIYNQSTATASMAAPAPLPFPYNPTATASMATATSAAPSPNAPPPVHTPNVTAYTSNKLSRTGSISHPIGEQTKTIWVAGVMLMALLFGWNMILLRDILYPWKMWVNSIHEGFHVLVGTLTGAKITSVSIDPDKGPISGMTDGQPFITLLAGYTGSVLVGSALIMCAFDTSASKVAALIVYPLLLVCFWFGRTWARIRVLACMAISVAFFFIDHASALRFYVLFLGILNAFYLVWDVVDDLIFRKSNESDVALLARMSAPTVHLWILLWFIVTLACVALAILGGLHFFNKDAEAQAAAQRSFLWTR